MLRGLMLLVAGLLLMAPSLCRPAVAAQSDALAPGHADSKTIVVTLRAAAVVDEPIVTVAAVATLQGGDPRLRQAIGGLDVAEVSQVGRTVAVSRDMVIYRIQLAGIDLQDFRVEGPDQALVKMTTVELTVDEVFRAAQQAVLQRAGWDSKDVEFRLLEAVRLPAVNITAEDQVHLAVEPLKSMPGPGKLLVDVAVQVNGHRCGVATVAMEAIVNGKATPPADEIVIRVRDTVKLMASVGNLTITAAGEALQDGKVGQIIRVRNIDSSKTIVGRVVNRSTVAVEY
jgi:hypothetical protein